MGTHVTKKIAQIRKLYNLIMNGTLLVVDPSSKSVGYAYYEKGALVSAGEVKTKATDDAHVRLVSITKQLVNKFSDPDVLAIEEIRGRMAHNVLMWSVGAIITALRPTELVEIPISMWHALRESDYIKTDAKDAALMAEAIFQVLDGSYGKQPAKSPRIRQVDKTKRTKTAKKEIAPEKRFSSRNKNRGRRPKTAGKKGRGRK
jgi:hypothetical protein